MRRKELFNRTAAAALSLTMAAGSVCPAQAAQQPQKDENVYVTLKEDGSVAGVYVVNEYVLEQKTEIVDHGDYTEVKNLSTEDEILLENGKVTVTAPEGKFYYQGTLENVPIPWEISIAYQLDGKEISAPELAGKSGKLKIILEIRDNKKSEDEFFDNYLVQGTVTLNTENCSNITAEGATQANVGKDRQLLYNIMAGQERTFEITADVTEFEMDAITFQAVPMSFDIDSDSIDKKELYEKTDEVKEAAADFDEGAGELKDGVEELADGVVELSDGSSELKDGAVDLKDGTSELLSGANSLSEGAASLNGGAQTLAKGSSKAKKGSAALSDGLDTLSGSLSDMQTGAQTLQTALDTLSSQSSALTDGSAAVLTALQQIQASLASIAVGTEQTQALVDASAGILTAIETAEQGAAQLDGGLQGMQAMYGETGEITALKAQNAAAAQGLGALVDMAYDYREKYGKVLELMEIDLTKVDSVFAEASASVAGVKALLALNSDTFDALKTQGIDVAEAGAAELQSGLETLAGKYDEFDGQIQSMAVMLNQMVVTQLPQLKTGIDTLVTEYEKLDGGIQDYTGAVDQIKAGYDTLYQGIVQAAGGTETLAEGAQELAAGNSQLSSGAGTLKSGTAELSSGAFSLASGALELNSGVGELYDGTVELYDGVSELMDGVSKLQDGTAELKDGTLEFVDETVDIDGKIDEEINKVLDEIAGSDFEQMSFVSPENTNVGLVQFAIQTEPIAIEEEETMEVEEETESLKDKLRNLFH